jgi:ABC-2 type transport system permease protein
LRSQAAAKYAACFRTGFRASLEYRSNFLLSLVSAIAPIAIQGALWIVLYGDDPSASLFGFSFEQMVAYTVIAQLVTRLTRAGFEYDLNGDIRSGSLDRYLVKPMSYMGFRLFSFLGDKAGQSALMGLLLAAALGALSLFFSFSLAPAALGLFLLSLLLAFVLNFLIFWCVGLSGFWLTEIGFLFEAARITIVAVSGGILPLAVFGPAAERVLSLLPFRFTIQFPTELLTGRLGPADALRPFALALAWIAGLSVIGRLLWMRGLRRFAAVGS